METRAFCSGWRSNKLPDELLGTSELLLDNKECLGPLSMADVIFSRLRTIPSFAIRLACVLLAVPWQPSQRWVELVEGFAVVVSLLE